MLGMKYIYFYKKFSVKYYLSINVNCIRPAKKIEIDYLCLPFIL